MNFCFSSVPKSYLLCWLNKQARLRRHGLRPTRTANSNRPKKKKKNKPASMVKETKQCEPFLIIALVVLIEHGAANWMEFVGILFKHFPDTPIPTPAELTNCAIQPRFGPVVCNARFYDGPSSKGAVSKKIKDHFVKCLVRAVTDFHNAFDSDYEREEESEPNEVDDALAVELAGAMSALVLTLFRSINIEIAS
jgi:hypothetical protein